MSFLTAALTALGGYGQGRQQRTQNQEEQQRLDIERENAESQRSYETQQTTALQNTNDQYQQSRAFEKGLKYPANWAKMAPADQYNYLQVRYNNAIAAGDTDAAKETLDQMNSLPRAGYEFANTQYTLQGKLPLAEAQTKAENDLPGRIRYVAQQHTQAEVEVAAQRFAGQKWLAQYNYGARWNIAQLAGAFRLQGYSEQDAARAAQDYYNGQVKEYTTGMNPEQSLLNPNYVQPSAPDYPGGAPGGPGTTVNVYGAGIGQPPPPVNPQAGPGVPSGGGQPGTPVQGAPPAAQQKYSAPQTLKFASDALKAGTPKTQVYAKLKAMVQSGQITPQAANGVELMLHLTP